MIRRDYIMKLVQQLLDSLFLLLNEKGIDEFERQKRLASLYKYYLGEDRAYYSSNNIQNILDFLEEKYSDELIHRVEMLSEVMYQDAMMEKDPKVKVSLLKKTLLLLSYLDENGDTYSLVRQGKVEFIRKELLLSDS